MTTTDQDTEDLSALPGGVGATGERTYGNWQRPPRGGLLGLGAIGTFVAFAVVILAVLCTMTLGLIAGGIVLLGGGLFTVLFALRDRDNRSMFDKGYNKLAFRKGERKGTTLYRSPTLTPTGTVSLPGVLGQITATEWEDVHGRPFALLSYPQGYHTVVFTASPDGDTGDDVEDVAMKVAYFGEWLSSQSSIAGMYSAQVIIETAPEAPGRLKRQILSSRADSSPELARTVMDQIGQEYPEGSDEYKVWITLTFRERDRIPRLRNRADRIEAMAASLREDMTVLVEALPHAGAAGVTAVDVQTLCEQMRVAWDPEVAPDVDEARAAGASIEAMSWDTAGPVAYQEHWDRLVHDSGVSTSYVMTRAPRQLVTAGVLRKLLMPGDFARKRVCLQYRVLSDEKAAAAAEKTVSDATFQHNASKKKTAAATAAVRAARLTAAEEATGAGIVDFTMWVTVTNLLSADHGNTKRKVLGLGATAKIKLRPMYGAQGAGFALGLPVGMQAEEHMTSPKWLSWVEEK